MKIETVAPISMIDRTGHQRIDLWAETEKPFHGTLAALEGNDVIFSVQIALSPGKNHCVVMAPENDRDRLVTWQLRARDGRVAASLPGAWPKPRYWKIYTMLSSHTDIGLHNSPYIQRHNSSQFLDEAMALCDQTEARRACDQYRYVMEGTWFWDNYAKDRGEEAARKVVSEYIQKKKIGLCVGIAGNHTQVFGLEEMCRAAQERKRIKDAWGVDSRTMSMIDNNGLSWGLVQPLAEAGYKNLLFAPNQWNPLNSTIWHMDGSVSGATWNPEAGGGGARIDMRFDSTLPRVFYWKAAFGKSKLLVWSGGNYGHGSDVFGFQASSKPTPYLLLNMEERTARQLPVMEEKYPYDLWLLPAYNDDQAPELGVTDCFARWNEKWAWPEFTTVGDIDQPFDELRARFDDQIPVIHGELTGGWYQHPLSAAELLAAKFEADRLLPTAEKLSSIACLIDKAHLYPEEAFDRAWNALLWNDEHSYGTSGYQGRRVYETWLQHRDWIEKAGATAKKEISAAMQAIGRQIATSEPAVLVFNPTALLRSDTVALPDGRKAFAADVPSVGYKVLPESAFRTEDGKNITTATPPVVENRWYRITFAQNGGMKSIYDKELDRELLDTESPWCANSFAYTRDNHQTFVSPEDARFELHEDSEGLHVTATIDEPVSGASVVQSVLLPSRQKCVLIDNRLDHVRDLFNDNRYHRYAYYAFPYSLSGARRLCHLNGCVAEYGVDLTGHGTDTYMAANEWCCAEKDGMGIGMVQLDSELVEFDHIHPDKTDFGDPGEGAGMFFYLANDWLQMHTSGGSQLNFRFRYAIVSYRGTYLSAQLPEFAERCAHPLIAEATGGGQGDLPPEMSFLQTSAGCRLIDLKRAKDGDGLIARLYSLAPQQDMGISFGARTLARNSITEEPMPVLAWQGFETVRIGEGDIRLQAREIHEPRAAGARFASIGSHYTGLVDQPRAIRGELDGHLYLLWGAALEEDLAGYRVYRGLAPDFMADDSSLVAFVEPEEYCVGRFSDTALARKTRYYYRVCAFDRDGNCGPLSEVFSALTKE